MKAISHCLSIDIEGFVEGMAESFPIPSSYFDRNRENYEIEVNVDSILSRLEDWGRSATFFFLGRIAVELPHLVRTVSDAGHEIGSHGYKHTRITFQTQSQFQTDSERSRKALEDVAGVSVRGFRAPDFSITQQTIWALDILREAGYEYDSSVTPTNIHDVYGIAGAKAQIHRLANGLWEFPPSTFSLFGRVVPFGGGGYLRLYPVWLTRKLIRRREKRATPIMIYMHPYELGPVAPKITALSLYRRFRHFYNISNGLNRLERVLNGFSFAPAGEIIDAIRTGKTV